MQQYAEGASALSAFFVPWIIFVLRMMCLEDPCREGCRPG